MSCKTEKYLMFCKTEWIKKFKETMRKKPYWNIYLTTIQGRRRGEGAREKDRGGAPGAHERRLHAGVHAEADAGDDEHEQ